MAVPELLRKSPLFAGFDDATLERLAEPFSEVEFPADQVMIEARTPGAGLFVICDGAVAVEAQGLQRELGPGDVIGEMGLLDNAPRSATVTALEDTETLELHATVMAVVVMQYPQVASALLRTLSRRLRSADELADALARRPPR